MNGTINLAVVGAGGFALFAVSEFAKNPRVSLVGVYDEVQANSLRFKNIRSELKIYTSFEDLCGDTSIDLVYIATPPYLHYPQSLAALLSGKHVICEKPAALRVAHAQELQKIANESGLLFVVNLMQRYNPLYQTISEIISHKTLGKFLHGFFENYASDEFLKEDHWFWNEVMSGGIFIEHGVHFFDMFNGWFTNGKVIASQKINKPGYAAVWDKVNATLMYEDALVNFYHAFNQPKAMDRQELRLQFEKGDITLYEWVPTQMKLTALCSQDDIDFFTATFPLAKFSFLENNDVSKLVRGNFKDISYQYKIHFNTGEAMGKQDLYQFLLREFFEDQMSWLHNRSHVRKITDNNAVDSLVLAEEADNQAERIQV
jgi:predicted dehydrogenase